MRLMPVWSGEEVKARGMYRTMAAAVAKRLCDSENRALALLLRLLDGCGSRAAFPLLDCAAHEPVRSTFKRPGRSRGSAQRRKRKDALARTAS